MRSLISAPLWLAVVVGLLASPAYPQARCTGCVLRAISGGINVDVGGAFGAGSGYSFGDGNTEWYERSDNTLTAYIGGSEIFAIDANELNSLKGGDGSIRLRFAAGADNVPNYSFMGDQDSGMYRVAANNIGFSVGGAKVFELGGSQTVLIEDPVGLSGVTLGVVKAGAGQAANPLWEWRNSSGTAKAWVNSSFGFVSLSVDNNFGINTATGANATMSVHSTGNDKLPLGVRGFSASQTEDLQQWQSSAGTVLASVGPSGSVNAVGFSSTGTITFADSADVASATTTALGTGNLFHLTGTATITTLDTCDAANNGRLLTLIFDGILTFTDGNNLKLAGDFVTTTDDVIQLACDGSNWYESARSVN